MTPMINTFSIRFVGEESETQSSTESTQGNTVIKDNL